MGEEKRMFTRYSLMCECVLATESGRKYIAEILDISPEGAKIITDAGVNFKIGDIIYFNIKCKYKIKVKAEIRWCKSEGKFVLYGIKFVEMSMRDRDSLGKLLSEIVLSSLDDSYFR